MRLPLFLFPLLVGCGASYPVPAQRMADAQSAQRSAQELGADKQPTAKLHLQLADEQIAKAKTVLQEDDNRKADFLLIRAKADAELALAIARAEKSKAEAVTALGQANSQSVSAEQKQGVQ